MARTSYKEAENYINEKFDELVPMNGPAPTLAGEIIRATCRIGYRFHNDGDMIGVGYGNETCNAAARFLYKKCNHSADICGAIDDLWGNDNEDSYEIYLKNLIVSVCEYLREDPRLEIITNTEDMFDYTLDSDFEYDEEEDMW